MIRNFIFALSFLFLPLILSAQDLSNIERSGSYTINSSSLNNGIIVNIFQPEVESDNGLVTFRWSSLELKKDEHISYELKIHLGDSLIFSTHVNEPQFQYSLSNLPHLVKNNTYTVTVDAWVSTDQKTAYIDGASSAIEFKYFPDCTIPKKVKISEIGTNHIVITWGGLPASKGELEYKIEYSSASATESFSPILVESGNEVKINDINAGEAYNVSIRKICYLEDGSILESDTVQLSTATNISERALVACGNSYSDSGCPGALATNPTTFTTLKMNGFDITSVSLTFNDGAYKGTGILQLPFQNKKVRVNITAKKITTAKIICEGTVNGISDLPAYWPNLFPPPSPYNQICLPPGTQVGFDPSSGLWMPDGVEWNPQGFSNDSAYVKMPPYPGYVAGGPIDTSGQYDPWGFDANCTNVVTGTEFDINGCSCYNTDIEGNHCNHTVEPYFWLTETSTAGPITEAGAIFANQKQTIIRNLITQYLSSEVLKIQIKIDSIHNACDSLRSIMTGLIGTLNYDNNLIIGTGGKYFNDGMNLNFSQAPEPFSKNGIDRNPNTINLENQHVELYKCDVNLSHDKNWKKVIQYFQSTTGLDSLTNVLLDIIKRLSAAEIQVLNNPDSLKSWVNAHVKEQIEAKYQALYGTGNSTGQIFNQQDFSPKNKITPFHRLENRISKHEATLGLPMSNMIASNQNYPDNNEPHTYDNNPDDVSWEFAQGLENIHGIDRGFFLEHLAKEREKASLFPEYFTEHDTLLQPIQIRKWIGGRYYDVYLDKVTLTRNASNVYTSMLDAYVIMDVPTINQKVVFKADNVNITPYGPNITPLELKLNDDLELRMSNAVLITLKKNVTFVKVDCNGFVGIGVSGKAEVCRKYIVPVNPTTLEVLPEPARASGTFNINLAHWSELYVSMSMDPFAVTGHEDYKWSFSNLTFDFSDQISPQGTPPPGYNSPFAGPLGFAKGWQGLYIQNLTIHLPKSFRRNNQPTSFSVEKVMVDELGFSGIAEAKIVLIPLNEGSAGGWAFSLEKFKLGFIANQLSGAGFSGRINVPIIKGGSCDPDSPLADADCFNYSADIFFGNKYQLTVGLPANQSYCADIWKAGKIEIRPNSTISLEYSNNKFLASARLFGTLNLQPTLGNFDLKLPDTIGFQNLLIKNTEPYFVGGTFSTPSGAGRELGGFGFSVNSLSAKKDTSSANAMALQMDIAVSLTKSKTKDQDSLGITATGRFNIIGELTINDNIQKWRFKKVRLNALSVNATFPGASILGQIAWYEDTQGPWGKGFRGMLKATFGKTMPTQIDALAHFGKTPESNGSFKYFFVDTKVILAQGIQFFPPFELKGFGGGVYHHMSRDTTPSPALGSASTPALPPNIGVSLSGIHYNPDPNAGLGLKATVVIAVPKDNAFNATLSMEALFNSQSSGGGLRSLYFDGTALLMQKVDLNMPPMFNASNSAAIKADFKIAAQFTPKFRLIGSGKTFVNFGNVITGVGPNNLYAGIDCLFEDGGNWYINMGTPGPNTMNGLKLKVGSNNLLEISTYMNLGKKIPPMPELPDNVKSLTGLSNMMISENVRRSGNGFAFGGKVEIGNKDRICVPGCNALLYFYGANNAAAGFDLMLMDYGSSICSNTGSALGINGWYASGQAYAKMQTGIGVGVKVFGQRKEIEILSLSAAAALQMKLPNPFWAKGAVGGTFRVLNGLVKGDVKFGFTIGTSCTFDTNNGDPEPELLVISSIDPYTGASGISVMAHPTVSFSIPIGQNSATSDILGTASVKPELEYVKVTRGNSMIPVSFNWQEDKMLLELTPNYMLPPNDTIKVEAKVKIYKNGVAQTPETKTVKFVTGDKYTVIPEENIKATYPENGQFNFYKSEWSEQKGYILLNVSQQDLLVPAPSEKILARVSKPDGSYFENPIKYLLLENRIEFPLPASLLQANQLYKLEIIKKQNGAIANIASKGVVPEVITQDENILYSSYFRTSIYSKFADKVGQLVGPPQTPLQTGPEGEFNLPITNTEPFSTYELNENNVNLIANLPETPWYTGYAGPLIYNKFGGSAPGQYGIWVDDRDVNIYGRIPYQAVDIYSSTGSDLPTIDEAVFNSGVAPVFQGQQYIRYTVPVVVLNDWFDICNDAFDYVFKECEEDQDYDCPFCWKHTNYPLPPFQSCGVGATNADVYINWFINKVFYQQVYKDLSKKIGYVEPTSGIYPVTFEYALPGLGIKTTIKKINISK